MIALMMQGSVDPAREYRELDRRTKTDAIRAARTGLVGIEELIESAINEDPPRFNPKEAHEIRDRYAHLAEMLENALMLLAQERDEFEQLNLQVRHVNEQLAAKTKMLKENQEERSRWYSEAMRLRRIMDKEGLKYDEEGT